MLHKFFESGDWFAAKSHGYGAGLPIAWQGWILLAGYLLSLLGFGLMMETGDFVWVTVGIVGFALATLIFVFIVKRRTRGGWKWRMGGKQ